MKIELYISQLLYRYPCVTVPGFGAFLAETQSAQLNESSNAFYPPKKQISFNSYLKHNDGLLANHIAQIEKTSYEEAVTSISSEVGIWNNILEINDRFTLKNIGELSLNDEKRVVFSPYEQLNYLTEAFGLNSFVSPAIKREQYKQQVEALEEKAPIVFTPENRKSRNYLKYTAVLVLALSAAGTFGYRIYQQNFESNTLLVKQEVQKEVQDRIQEATFFLENPAPAVTLTVKEEKMPYHIVAGAFRMEANADKTHRELLEMGFHSKKLEPNKFGLYPVLYGSYANYGQAYKDMIKIKKKHNPDAWLLIKELN